MGRAPLRRSLTLAGAGIGLRGGPMQRIWARICNAFVQNSALPVRVAVPRCRGGGVGGRGAVWSAHTASV